MVRKGFVLGTALVAFVVLLWATGGVVAGPPFNEPGSGVTIAGTVASSISYQGRLTEADGSPLDGTYTLQFQLYDAQSGGTMLWDSGAKSVQVDNGLFNVELDVDQADFNGQELWLAVKVDGEWMTSRQQMLPVPYALSLRPGAVINGGMPVLTAQSGHALGQLARLHVVSIIPFVSYSVGVYGEGEWGVYGYSVDALGVRGESVGTSGVGVQGFAQALSGTTYGVYGIAQSPDGYGGYFDNRATSGHAYGVYGKSDSTEGWGVQGHAAATSGYTIGVYGRADSSGGQGVLGYATATTGGGIGVYGLTASSSGRGVWGFSQSTSGGHGVYAQSRGPGGSGAALYTINDHTDGIALWGKAQGSDSTMVLEHKAGAGDFIRAFQTDPSDLRFRVAINGNVYADGPYSTPASDFAEMLPATEGLEPGDVLVIGPDGKLARSTTPYATNVVGVYSTNPGFVGGSINGDDQTGKAPLAIAGIVPVKASAENGPIEPGDLLTSACKLGYAMKATDLKMGTIIGKALEGLSKGTGVIKMLVMLQ